MKKTHRNHPRAAGKSTLTVKEVLDAFQAIKKVRMPVVWFYSRLPLGVCLKGEQIDSLLDCKKDEKGFVLSGHYKKDFISASKANQWGPLFIERDPTAIDREIYTQTYKALQDLYEKDETP